MNKNIAFKFFISLILSGFLLTACSNKNTGSIVDDMFDTESNDNGQLTQADYEFPFGPNDIEIPVKINEDKLEYEIYIDNRASAAEFGIMIAIDGIPQISTLGNDNSMMHKVSLKTGEYETYKFIMEKGNLEIDSGKEHIIYPLIILEPDYIPTNRNHFIHEGKLSASKGLQFVCETDKQLGIKIGNVKPVKIDDRFKSEYNIKKNFGFENQILWNLDTTNNAFISLEDLSKGFDINLIGDNTGEMRIFLFINNHSVSINGYDCYDIKIQSGMVTKINVELDKSIISKLRNDDSIFLIALPKNSESVDAWPYKTRTKIVKGI